MRTRSHCIAVILIVSIILAYTAGTTGQVPPTDYYVGYELSFSRTIANKGPVTIDLTLNELTTPTTSLFMNDSSQVVKLISSSHKVTTSADPDGNLVGILQVERMLKPGQSVTIETSFKAFPRMTQKRRFEWNPELEYSRSGLKQDIPKELTEKYCSSSGPWRINDADQSWLSVRRLAFKLAGNETNVLKAVMRLVEWTGQNVKYPSVKGDRILLPNETLTVLEGDCDEQANLIISFCRTLGIPAYLQYGCMYLPSKVEKVSKFDGRLSFHFDRIGWHAWAMIYVPPWEWLPVDMTIGYSKEDAFLAIQAAAPQTLSTIISGNYFMADYVTEANYFGEQLKRTEVRIEQKETMKPIAISPEYQATAAVLATTITLVGFGVSIVATYVILRRRSKNRLG